MYEVIVILRHDSYGVRAVCICQTIRRRAAVVFNHRFDTLTRYLWVLSTISYAIYWVHRDFCRACYSFFSAEGIHLNNRGQYKFYRSLLGAVLKCFYWRRQSLIFFVLLFIWIKFYAVLLNCGPIPSLFVSAL